MLRNQQQNKQLLKNILHIIQKRLIQQQNAILYNKSTDVTRQGKIMKKLFDHRVSGSKKRWFPSATDAANNNVMLKGMQFGKAPNRGGKNGTRRISVLNKLFMEHITDLMATGEISDCFLDRGLQILRVKISQDFAYINVFWVSTRDEINDVLLEHELNRCSGLLRHELSQLGLMGVVPRIKFVKDKLSTNMNHIDTLLRNMDFGSEEEEQQENDTGLQLYTDTLKQEFYGSKTQPTSVIAEQGLNDDDKVTQIVSANVPQMRHDVMGLNHKDIMDKILTKMRKSRQAWDKHLQKTSIELNSSKSTEYGPTIPSTTYSQLSKNKAKYAESTAESDKFEEFLAQRKERRNTPERKKFRSSNRNFFEVNEVDENNYLEEMTSKDHLEADDDYILNDIETRKH